MFDASDIAWGDFEVLSPEIDLKAAGPFAYAADTATRAIVLAYALGNEPALTWHCDGAILDWNHAPSHVRGAFARRTPFAFWNAGFDSTVWNYSTLGFPYLEVERVIDIMIQATVSNLPAKLEDASRALGGEGKQADGKKLIKMFSIDGASPRDYPAEWERYLSYARRDVEAMRDVYRRTRPLPLAELQQYWAFEQHNRRGVMLDMPFVRHAAVLAAEDVVANGRRLAELTGKAVTSVTQAKRLATWLYDQLPDAAMREVLTVSASADDDVDDDDDDSDE
jgi:DNA polymerase